MIADKLISRLEGIRSTRQDRWLAKCPAHDDRSPSLAIRQVDDRVLIHCFAGCEVYDIVSSVGMELSDLFPEKIIVTGNKPIKKPFPAEDVIRALSSDVLFLQVCSRQMSINGFIFDENRRRLEEAANRFDSALQAGGLS